MPIELRRLTTQRTAWFAIAAVFFVNGVTLASWISRIPALTERLELSPGQVGLALMGLAAGALVAFPIAGRLIDSRSSRFIVVSFGLIMILSLPILGIAPNLFVFVSALLLLGFGNGGMDVSMNAQGIQVQRFVGRSIISSLHGCFSLGAFVGAAIGAGVAQLGALPLVHFLGVTAFGLAALSWIRRFLIPDTNDPRKSDAPAAFAVPPRSLWLLGTLALDRKSTRLNSSHTVISYAVFCLKKKIIAAIEAGLAGAVIYLPVYLWICFFFNDTATTEIYTLSLHDALPIRRSCL